MIYKDFNSIGSIFSGPETPIIVFSQQPEGWSAGWKWHPSRQFDLQALNRWLEGLNWLRAKLVVHGSAGWMSSNSLKNRLEPWKNAEWRKDSRIELIFDAPQDLNTLTEGLQQCLSH